jgi:SAM-dependent MidA family methyltransferase
VQSLHDELVERVRRQGPVRFDRFMELALYDPARGFYAQEGRAGRRGDFITSPEVGPLFGAVVAGALDEWWHELGEPDPFTVVEAGAGAGALARSVVAAEPACADALTYLEVEHPGGWPDEPITGVVLANELLDNLPFRMFEHSVAGWLEVVVALELDDGTLTEGLVVVGDDLERELDARAPVAADGERLPFQEQAAEWVTRALATVERGRVVVIDYAAPTYVLAERNGGWLRTYRGHERGGRPLDDIGEQDITADLALDQILDGHPPASVSTQAEFLRHHGIDALVGDGRRVWHERAHIGDLEAIRGRSRVGEAEALLDPDGLGSFTVVEWVKP